MKSSNATVRVIAAVIAVPIVQMIGGAIGNLLLPARPVPNLPQHLFSWLLLTNALTAATLAVVALRSEWRGWRLGLSVAAIPVIIMLTSAIEGIAFLKNFQIDWPSIILSSLIGAVLSVPVWTWLFGRRANDPQAHFHPIASKSRLERAWKFVVSDASYFLWYFVAGMIVWPYVKDFYMTSASVPKFSAIIALQLLVRGPIFVVLCLMLVRMLGLSRLNGALAVGAVFTMLSGVVPLLTPNPYFPDAVRWAHFCEVTSSNFVFGAVVAALWGQPRLVREPPLAHAEISPQAPALGR